MRNLVLLQELCALLLQESDEEDFLDRVAVNPYVATVYVLTRKKRIIIYEPSTNEVKLIFLQGCLVAFIQLWS